MKFRSLSKLTFAVTSLFLIPGSSFGQNIITLDHATGTYGTSSDTLEVGQDVNLFIRWTQNAGANINGYSLGFKIYSDDGAQWVATDSGAYTGAITGGMIDFSFINHFSLDGMGADTVAFSGFALFGTGIPDPFDEVVWSISLGTIDASQACKTICIDSAFFPPGGPWQWSVLGAGAFNPDWGGPYCFLIFDPANPCDGEPDPPVLGAIGSQNTTECVSLLVPLTATDPQNHQLTFTVEGGPPGAVLTDNGDGTGSFDWTPAKGDGGNYNVLFIVTANSSSLADSEMVSISVAADGSPTFAAVAPQTVQECQLLSVGVTATDPEAAGMTLMISSGPPSAAITDNGDGTGTVTWTPTAGDAGAAIITVTATDACGSAGTVDINITVEADSPPVLAAIGSQTVIVGQTLTLSLSAVDPEGTIPVITSPDAPAASVLTDHNDGTATFEWTPDIADVGQHPVTFVATDGCGSTDEEEVDILVVETSENTPPFIDPISDFSISECDTIEAMFTATDVDGDPLTLWVEPLVNNMTATDNGDGTLDFLFTPGFAQAGVYEMELFASDQTATVSELFTINVADCLSDFDAEVVITPDMIFAYFSHAIDPMSGIIYFGNITDSHTVADVDPASLLINGSIPPLEVNIIGSVEGFNGDVLEIIYPMNEFIASYGLFFDTTVEVFTVSGIIGGDVAFEVDGLVTLRGHLSGDLNNDGRVDIIDITLLVDYLFRGGSAPDPIEAAELNADGMVDLIDLMALIEMVFPSS